MTQHLFWPMRWPLGSASPELVLNHFTSRLPFYGQQVHILYAIVNKPFYILYKPIIAAGAERVTYPAQVYIPYILVYQKRSNWALQIRNRLKKNPEKPSREFIARI